MDDGRTAEVDRLFHAEPASAAAARREIEMLAWTLDADESSVLALLVTELITNSVLHAPSQSDGAIRLEVNVTRECVRVRVTDGGNGFVAPSSPSALHWGLHVLDSLADRWEITGSPSTVVAFELDRRTRPQAEAPGPGTFGAALAEQARLSDAYARAIGTSSEMASYERLRAAGRDVTAMREGDDSPFAPDPGLT